MSCLSRNDSLCLQDGKIIVQTTLLFSRLRRRLQGMSIWLLVVSGIEVERIAVLFDEGISFV